MENLQTGLYRYAEELEAFHLPRWESLPEIDLYMDQVMALMDKYLSVFGESGKDKIITPAMINNYVKLGIIPPPVKKKYSRSHLAHLITVCLLKPVLPIPAVKELLAHQTQNRDISDVFDLFCSRQEEALREVAHHVKSTADSLEEGDITAELSRMSLNFASFANAYKVLGERMMDLIFLIQQEEQQEASEREAPEKEKAKAKTKVK